MVIKTSLIWGRKQIPRKQCRGLRSYQFDPWVRKIPWRRKWQPTLGLLPGEFHGQRSLEGPSPQGSQRVGHDMQVLEASRVLKKMNPKRHTKTSVQSLSHVQIFSIPWTAACQASLSITNSWSLLKLMSFESVMPSNLLSPSHPTFNLSQHQGLFQ